MESLTRFSYSFEFFAIAIVGLAILVAMYFLGFLEGDHDFDHGEIETDHGHSHVSFLSVRMLALFITGFGIGGFFGTRLGFGIGLDSFLGVLFGAAMAGLGHATLVFFHHSQASSAVTTQQIIGAEGVVTTTVPSGGVGEVNCHINGAISYHPARSLDGDEIRVGRPVQITAVSGSTVIVEPYKEKLKR